MRKEQQTDVQAEWFAPFGELLLLRLAGAATINHRAERDVRGEAGSCEIAPKSATLLYIIPPFSPNGNPPPGS